MLRFRAASDRLSAAEIARLSGWLGLSAQEIERRVAAREILWQLTPSTPETQRQREARVVVCQQMVAAVMEGSIRLDMLEEFRGTVIEPSRVFSWYVTAVRLDEDPRYDLSRQFEATSVVAMDDACDRILARFGERHRLSMFHVDGDTVGNVYSTSAESRGDSLALRIGVELPIINVEEAGVVFLPIETLRYTISLLSNSERIDWNEKRQVRMGLEKAFECPLAPLPRKYFV